MGRPRKLTPTQEAQLVKMVSTGEKKYQDIADSFGVSAWTARMIARRHGVSNSYRPRGHGFSHRDLRSRRRAYRLREKGWTLQKIADRMEISRQRVHQLLKSYVPPPPVPENAVKRGRGRPRKVRPK